MLALQTWKGALVLVLGCDPVSLVLGDHLTSQQGCQLPPTLLTPTQKHTLCNHGNISPWTSFIQRVTFLSIVAVHIASS